MYCGGGYRSALACDMAQKMGYKNVYSLIGGYKGLLKAGWPMNTDANNQKSHCGYHSNHSHHHNHSHNHGHSHGNRK
jgi:3-mercaptopyruvate sulfurtransferase SseA